MMLDKVQGNSKPKVAVPTIGSTAAKLKETKKKKKKKRQSQSTLSKNPDEEVGKQPRNPEGFPSKECK